jgi:hypothetical protein
MKIVINSHKKGTIALDHLLDSMRKCEEFNEYTIFVCIGGFYDILGYELHLFSFKTPIFTSYEMKSPINNSS